MELSRSQKFVMAEYFNFEQNRESGLNTHYGFVLVAGAKAETLTRNLPLALSVLGGRNI